MRKGVSLLIVTALLFSTMLVFAVPTTPAAPAQGGKTILFITGYGMNMPWTNITLWLTSQGHTVRNATTINATNLAGVDALILCSPYGAAGRVGFNATGAPAILSAIATWFLTGSKFLWVSGDSDYYSVGVAGDWIPLNCSAILQAVGSPLRFEPMSVEDPLSNCGSAYRVKANVTITTGDAATITTGVTNVLFHGPTCVYALDATGTPVALENVTVPNVFNIMRTGGSGKVLDGQPTATGVVHVAGRIGSWVMMAGQKYAGILGNSKIIASGASPYGDYQCMYSNAYYGRSLEGALLCQQAYKWGLTVETLPTLPPIPGFPLVAIALGLGLVLVPTIIFRRRRQH